MLQEKKDAISELTLIPSGGGAFEITVDGRPIWSKKKTHSFPEYEVVSRALDGTGGG